jgi:dodecin
VRIPVVSVGDPSSVSCERRRPSREYRPPVWSRRSRRVGARSPVRAALDLDRGGDQSRGVAVEGTDMPESVYKVIELVGTSTESWEKAAAAAVARASGSVRDLRVAEVSELDMTIEDGAVMAYRAKVKVSFKYEEA